MEDLSKYERMFNAGASPEQIYAAAKLDHGDNFSYIRLIRQLLGVTKPEAIEIIDRGKAYFFEEHILPQYVEMRENGASPQEVYLALEDEGVQKLDRIRIVKAVFELTFAEVKEVSIQASRTKAE